MPDNCEMSVHVSARLSQGALTFLFPIVETILSTGNERVFVYQSGKSYSESIRRSVIEPIKLKLIRLLRNSQRNILRAQCRYL